MKYLVILAIGVALGIYLDHRYPLQLPGPASVAAGVAGPTPESDRLALEEKMREWRLTPDDIRQDLSRTGEVVRTQAHVVAEKISDARIVAVVKAKYILDRDLSAFDVHVSAAEGRVTLAGSVGSPDHVGRAVALALDTDGVVGVEARLSVPP